MPRPLKRLFALLHDFFITSSPLSLLLHRQFAPGPSARDDPACGLPADRARVHFGLAVTSAHQPWGLIWPARSVHESGGRNCTQRSHRCSPLGLSSYCTRSFSAFCCGRVPGGRGHEGDGEGALKGSRDRARGQSLT